MHLPRLHWPSYAVFSLAIDNRSVTSLLCICSICTCLFCFDSPVDNIIQYNIRYVRRLCSITLFLPYSLPLGGYERLA